MTSPSISIVVPVYRCEARLARCLDSLIAQTFQDFEVILVDDASPDGSLAVAEAYEAKLPRCTILHHDVNKGVAEARNTGVRAATGDWIGFVDADDAALPTMLETLFRLASQHDCDIAQVGYRTIAEGRESEDGGEGEDGNAAKPENETVRVLTPREALRDMLETEQYALWNRLYARSLFRQDGTDFVPGLTCEDRIANAKLIASTRRVVVSNREEYLYFTNQGSISYNGLDARAFDIFDADDIVVSVVEQLGDADLAELARDRAAKGAFSLLVKWARFGIADVQLTEREALPPLWERFERDYPRLMSSPISAPKKIAAWQLKHCPALLRAEFRLLNALTNRNRKARTR